MTELEKAASLKEKADYKYSVSVEALKMLIEKQEFIMKIKYILLFLIIFIFTACKKDTVEVIRAIKSKK